MKISFMYCNIVSSIDQCFDTCVIWHWWVIEYLGWQWLVLHLCTGWTEENLQAMYTKYGSDLPLVTNTNYLYMSSSFSSNTLEELGTILTPIWVQLKISSGTIPSIKGSCCNIIQKWLLQFFILKEYWQCSERVYK